MDVNGLSPDLDSGSGSGSGDLQQPSPWLSPNPRFVVSVDPGTRHCGVVRYDAAQDRFTHASLLNVLCTCEPEDRGVPPPPATIADLVRRGGPVPVASTSPKSATGGIPRWPTLASIHVPTPTDYPLQLACAIAERPEIYDGADLVAIERQNTQDTGNMVVQAALQTRYIEQALIVVPLEVKRFWNEAALGAGIADPAFRLTGSYSENKTDAKRLAARVLSPEERALFGAAATENAQHKARCPVMYKLGRKRKRGTGGPKATKSDDLMDAALQAIYAAQVQAASLPDAVESVARRRFERYRNTPASRAAGGRKRARSRPKGSATSTTTTTTTTTKDPKESRAKKRRGNAGERGGKSRQWQI